MKFYSFQDLEKKFYNKEYLDVISKINYNISIEKADVYQLELLGVCYLKLNLDDNALIVFKHIKNKYPKFHQVNINYATVLRKKGFIEDSIKIYNEIVAANPNDHDALNNIGVAYLRKNNFNKAITYYKKAIKIKKDKNQYYINLCNALIKLKKNKLVTKILLDVLKKSINKDEIKNFLAVHYIVNCKNYIQGENLYKNLIKNKTLNSDVYHNYAYYLQNKNKNFEYCLKLLKKCLSLNKNFYQAYNTLGIIYYKKGFVQKAIKFYEKSYQLTNSSHQYDDDLYHLQHNLGTAYIRKLINLDIAWELR